MELLLILADFIENPTNSNFSFSILFMKQVYCAKYKKNLDAMAQKPFVGELSTKIFEEVSQQAWDDWLELQTKLINEFKINLLENSGKNFLLSEMEKFLFEEDYTIPKGVPRE